MNDYVCGFLKGQNEILLIQKNKPDWQKGLLNGVGGKIEVGETPMEAMHREWKEESISAPSVDWTKLCILTFGDSNIHFFKAEKANLLYSWWEDTNDIGEKFHWFHMNKLAESDKVIPNLKWLIPLAFTDDSHFTGYISKN